MKIQIAKLIKRTMNVKNRNSQKLINKMKKKSLNNNSFTI